MRGFVCMMQTMKLLICKQQLITSGNNGETNWSYIPSKGKSTKTQFEFVSCQYNHVVLGKLVE